MPPPGPVALVLQDVTETRRTEAVRRDFVANVGHELKTPVGALSLLAEAIEQAADDPEAVQRFAGRIAHEADRLSRLVRELIDLSRLQGGEPLPELVPVDVDRVIAEAVDRTRTAARAKGLDIAVGGEHGLVVRGVEGQLSTAVTNLLANAVAYSEGENRIAVAARARSGFAEIAVTDSGIGIPRQDRQRVFERFYRVDQSRASSTGGTGLGLAIVKHVASNHGGVGLGLERGGPRLDLHPPHPVGRGRSRSPSKHQQKRRREPHDPCAGGGGRGVLLRRAVLHAAAREGFEAVVAGSGPEALAEFDRGGADIVLLDLMLPGLSGTEVCRDAAQPQQRADHHAHRQGRRDRQGRRPGARRRRLRDQAVLGPRAGRPHPGGAAPPRRRRRGAGGATACSRPARSAWTSSGTSSPWTASTWPCR